MQGTEKPRPMINPGPEAQFMGLPIRSASPVHPATTTGIRPGSRVTAAFHLSFILLLHDGRGCSWLARTASSVDEGSDAEMKRLLKGFAVIALLGVCSRVQPCGVSSDCRDAV